MKKSYVKLFSVIMFVIIFTIGCSSSDETSSNESGSNGSDSSEEQVTLKAIMEQVPDADIVESMLTDFNEVHPNITLDIEMLPYDQMREKIIASSLAPESVYDLIIVDNPWMYDFATEGHLEALNDRIDAAGDDYNYEDFAAPLRDIAEVDGDVYAIPFYNYALGLIYRSDLFEENNLSAPATLDDLQSIAETLTTDSQSGIAMQPQRGYKIFEEWANWLFAAGGEIQDTDGNITLDSDAAVEALTKYIETFEASAPADSINWGFDEALRSVSSDQSAMMLSYNWMLPTLNHEDSPAGDLSGDFQLEEVPGGKAVLGAWYWAIPSNAKYSDEAWEFIHWITSPEQDLERVLQGGAPIRMSVMEEASEMGDEGFGAEYYQKVTSILENAAPLADGPNAEEMIQVVGTELSEAVAGNKSPEQAIEDAANQARKVMNE